MSEKSKLGIGDIGGLWEEPCWSLYVDYECSGDGGGDRCPHCSPVETKVYTRRDGSTWEEEVWVCPFVVVAYNEGGYSSTGVCLQCIVEQTADLLKEEAK